MPDSRPPTRWEKIVAATTGSTTGMAATYRARLLSTVMLGTIPVLVLLTTVSALFDFPEGKGIGLYLVVASVVMATLFATLVLNSRGHTKVAGATVVVCASAAIIATVATGGGPETDTIVYLAPVTILAGFLLVPRALVLLIAAQVGALLLIPFALADVTYPEIAKG